MRQAGLVLFIALFSQAARTAGPLIGHFDARSASEIVSALHYSKKRTRFGSFGVHPVRPVALNCTGAFVAMESGECHVLFLTGNQITHCAWQGEALFELRKRVFGSVRDHAAMVCMSVDVGDELPLLDRVAFLGGM